MDFALALGGDRTDEDTFWALPGSAYPIRVGTGAHSLARFQLPGVPAVRELLRQLT